MSTKMKKAFVIKTFKVADPGDAERRFESGAIADIAEGEFINLKAAGLIREAAADDAKAKTAA